MRRAFSLFHLYLGISAGFILLLGCRSEPSPALSPQDELATFEVVPGYRVELVAAEPMVQDPVTMSFDENGRLWVVEMLGFMPEIDGSNEEAPVGRISILLDMDFDGRMDSAIIFQDSLVLPRALALVNGGALVAEDVPLWYFEDLDGDLVADTKTLIDSAYGVKGVVEHSPNGLLRGLDNWYYNAKADFRYKNIGNIWVKEKTEFRGQWGISQDNIGRLYYNYNWSQLHADLVPPNYLSRNKNHSPSSGIDHVLSLDRQIFPIRENEASNRGYLPGVLDENRKLKEFTSACAPWVYRGDLYSPDLAGDVFVCEPTANLIKHNLINSEGVIMAAKNAYPGKEFLASSDERFRPVWLTEGPDGALYIADMYRGVIQHGLYMSDYLRKVTLDRRLDRPINMGRIWRIVPDEKPKREILSYSNASIKELVTLLSHKNGWHRDLGQRLLVEKKSIEAIPDLEHIVKTHRDELPKIHALWTLDGLGHDDQEIYFEALLDHSPLVNVMALRVLENIVSDHPTLINRYKAYLADTRKNKQLDLQITLSSGILNSPDKLSWLLNIFIDNARSPVFRDAIMSSIENLEFEFLRLLMLRAEKIQDSIQADIEIMMELLTAAIVSKGDPEEISTLLKVIPDISSDKKKRAILTGLAIQGGKIDSTIIELTDAPQIFNNPHFKAVFGDQLQQINTFLSWPGKKANQIDSRLDSIQPVDPIVFSRGRQVYLTICASCHGNDGAGLPRFAPPLVRSEWVLGDENRLTLILLHGMSGPMTVNGKVYDYPEILPEMPAFASTTGTDLASVMTYIRRAWGHKADPVSNRSVGSIRIRTQGKITPWTEDELLKMEFGQRE